MNETLFTNRPSRQSLPSPLRASHDPPSLVVIDLETLGTAAGSVICQIAAARIDADLIPGFAADPESDPSDAVTDLFHEDVSIASGIKAGLTIDPETVAWWLRQDRKVAANVLLPKEPVDLGEALHRFTGWLYQFPPGVVYGKGPSFDLGILAAAYEAFGKPTPWHYTDERCLRTERMLLEHFGVPWPKVENPHPHHAVHDATTEAVELATARIAAERMRMEPGRK